MNILRLLPIFTALYLSTACEPRLDPSVVDCKAAADAAQHVLAIHEPVTVRELHGGLSGAKLFLVTANSKSYVLRFSSSTHLDPNEIACLQIASDTGYGPRLYAIDPDQRYVIMEYITPHPISKEDRSSKQLYQALGEVVSKIHHGPNFSEHQPIFTIIKHDIEHLKNRPSLHNLATRMEKSFSVVQKALAPVTTKAPCHNDLNPNNTLYTGSSFKIIDYELAGQDDPYFDLATVIQFNCLNPEDEKELLHGYLGRDMIAKEKARLYVMKQAVRIRFAASLILYATSSDKADQGEIDVGTESYEEFATKSDPEKFDYHRLAFHLFKLASTSLESEEFRQAVKTIEQGEKSLSTENLMEKP
jgi:thiamine kinase-like enzyme